MNKTGVSSLGHSFQCNGNYATDWKGRRDPNVIGLFWRHSLVFDRTKIYNEIR